MDASKLLVLSELIPDRNVNLWPIRLESVAGISSLWCRRSQEEVFPVTAAISNDSRSCAGSVQARARVGLSGRQIRRSVRLRMNKRECPENRRAAPLALESRSYLWVNRTLAGSATRHADRLRTVTGTIRDR